MSGLVVITRPEVDASDYADELGKLGLRTFIEPMLSLKPLAFDPPSLIEYDGVLATSANALDFYASGGGHTIDIPVYCVGKHTADAARGIGFHNVISVNGTGADLLDYVLALPDIKDEHLFHICGRHVAFPIVQKLSEAGIKADALSVYDSIQVRGFSSEFMKYLEDGDIGAVTFFSKRTAEAFVRNVLETESQSLFSGIKSLSISEAVLECVRVLPWGASYVSQTPDRAGMMQLLKAYVLDHNLDE